MPESFVVNHTTGGTTTQVGTYSTIADAETAAIGQFNGVNLTDSPASHEIDITRVVTTSTVIVRHTMGDPAP
jgi:hypothetical protein